MVISLCTLCQSPCFIFLIQRLQNLPAFFCQPSYIFLSAPFSICNNPTLWIRNKRVIVLFQMTNLILIPSGADCSPRFKLPGTFMSAYNLMSCRHPGIQIHIFVHHFVTDIEVHYFFYVPIRHGFPNVVILHMINCHMYLISRVFA